jgi:hypothetical protein
VATGLLPVLLFGICLGWRRYWGAVGIAAWLILVGSDLMRGQPWLYEYVLIACLAGGRPRACRLILAGIFFWAGIAKLNPFFFGTTGPWLTGRLPGFKHIYLLLPFAEIAAGLVLPMPGQMMRWISRTLITCISIGALVCLIPLRWNSVVWPWQIANVALVWLATAPIQTQRQFVSMHAAWGDTVAAFFSMAMPALIFFGIWPAYFSWRVYDGRPGIPLPLQEKVLAELNVPVPPDPWVLRRFGDSSDSVAVVLDDAGSQQ